MESRITITVSIPDELVAFVNALGALGSTKDDLGLVADKVSKSTEEVGDLPAEFMPQQPSVSFEDLRELIVKVTANPDKRDSARKTLADAGFSRISEVKDRPDMLEPLFNKFTELLNAA